MLDRLATWLAENVWMLIAVGGGILVSIITSDDHSLKSGTGRILAGLFFAVVFPDPILTFLDRDPVVYGNALAGLLAMTGYAIAKALVSTGPLDWIAAWRGKK
ncbi:hypothetical protein ATO8_18630 [Roseivivax marinus]|uniref:Uncharacterized protein n=1 Tax=Roseivivax marinus TaxID=1379903 RepID=W4HFM3_9RHOB|nr:hypothetical protein [Roseivivax marinus]ETW11198.1 hypothetical protein ATO8_18630 [Roseivivax marinus]